MNKLKRIKYSEFNCCETRYNPETGGKAAIGQDFVYSSNKVKESAFKQGLNLNDFFTLPIAVHLFEKKLKNPVSFWYIPTNDFIIITVCSKLNVNFMNPLHRLPGYAEYGENYLRQKARPFVYWNGESIFRIHPVYKDTPSEHLVADFGSILGLSAAESDDESFNEILHNPIEYIDYITIPSEPEQKCNWDGKTFMIKHAITVIPDI